MTLEGLGTAIAGAIAVDVGKEKVKDAGRRVGDVAAQGIAEGVQIDGAMPAPLWSQVNPHLLELSAIDARQAALVGALLHEQRTQLDGLIRAIKDNQPTTFAEPFWFAAGDVTMRRSLPVLNKGSGQWILDGFTAFTDPSAAADATLDVNISSLGITFRITAARANPTNVALGLPITAQGDAELVVDPAPGAGGAVTDRICLIARFKRNN